MPNNMMPKVQNSYEGHIVKFTCISESPVTWKFSGKPFFNKINMNEPGTNKHKLVILAVQHYNAGTHTCYGKHSDNLLFMSSGVLRVEAGYKISI